MKFLAVSHAPLAVADDSRLHTDTNGSREATLLHKTFLLSAFPPPPPPPPLGNAIDSNTHLSLQRSMVWCAPCPSLQLEQIISELTETFTVASYASNLGICVNYLVAQFISKVFALHALQTRPRSKKNNLFLLSWL